MKVKEVKSIEKGYIGMNPAAGKELGVKCPPRTILVKKSLSPKQKQSVVAHERIEYSQMRRGLKYKSAHKIANALTKPKRRK